MKAELLVSGITIGVGLVLLALTMHMRLEADYTLETAKSIVFRPRVVVYRQDVPIVIGTGQMVHQPRLGIAEAVAQRGGTSHSLSDTSVPSSVIEIGVEEFTQAVAGFTVGAALNNQVWPNRYGDVLLLADSARVASYVQLPTGFAVPAHQRKYRPIVRNLDEKSKTVLVPCHFAAAGAGIGAVH